jgi:hypothetical protein
MSFYAVFIKDSLAFFPLRQIKFENFFHSKSSPPQPNKAEIILWFVIQIMLLFSNFRSVPSTIINFGPGGIKTSGKE